MKLSAMASDPMETTSPPSSPSKTVYRDPDDGRQRFLFELEFIQCLADPIYIHSLVSVMHIIDKLRLHPRPPISLHKNQVESLTQKISFLQEFLEAYNPHLGYSAEADPLESRIADAAYAAEDVIESHIMYRITSHGEKMSSDGLYDDGLEKVIEEMDSIKKEAIEIEEKMGVQRQLHIKSLPPDSADSVRSSSSMMGAADVLREMKDKLTGGRLALQIIPIVGMGGSGKTTLATNIYQDLSMKDNFYICAWATISQEYSISEIFGQVLPEVDKQDILQSSENELGEMLHKYLFGRKYLIIMDDMWSIEAWEKVGRFFPDNKNGSRIVITTRLSNLASELPGSNSLEMRLLDDVESWDLLSRIVFGEKGCPIELEGIGKKIGKSCKGLPLSIVVVGGFLARSAKKREFWVYTEENLNSIVNLVDDERCLRILHMSYKQLPIYLKPCFLYMGVFPGDDVISISKLTTLWVSERFLKPINGKCLEETAREYLKELTDRNLVLIHELGSIGNIKYCKIHDLLRDFCLREAQKERFYIVATPHDLQGVATNTHRRIVISSTLNYEDVEVLQSMSLARSLIWNFGIQGNRPPSLSLRLLRIFQLTEFPHLRNMIELASTVNLRYVDGMFPWDEKLLSSIYQLWDLETLIVGKALFLKSTLPIEIWCMPQLRQIRYEELYLTDPPGEIVLLGSLQTLKRVINFKCSDEVVKRIPNLKKLQTLYKELDGRSCLSNLVCLRKLESLDCFFIPKIGSDFLQGLSFPQSLKKLKLRIDFSQGWQDILEKIGTLPHLQKLKLYHGCFEACKWETVEGHFCSLKFLEIVNCYDLKEWITESSHFPFLEHLVLNTIDELQEIPLDFAGIATLGLIELKYCSESVVISAKGIVEEQEQLYGEVWVEVRVM